MFAFYLSLIFKGVLSCSSCSVRKGQGNMRTFESSFPNVTGSVIKQRPNKLCHYRETEGAGGASDQALRERRVRDA